MTYETAVAGSFAPHATNLRSSQQLGTAKVLEDSDERVEVREQVVEVECGIARWRLLGARAGSSLSSQHRLVDLQNLDSLASRSGWRLLDRDDFVVSGILVVVFREEAPHRHHVSVLLAAGERHGVGAATAAGLVRQRAWRKHDLEAALEVDEAAGGNVVEEALVADDDLAREVEARRDLFGEDDHLSAHMVLLRRQHANAGLRFCKKVAAAETRLGRIRNADEQFSLGGIGTVDCLDFRLVGCDSVNVSGCSRAITPAGKLVRHA